MFSETQSGDVFDHHCVEFTFADGAKLFVQTRLISGCWIASAAEAHGPAGVARLDRGEIRARRPGNSAAPCPIPTRWNTMC